MGRNAQSYKNIGFDHLVWLKIWGWCKYFQAFRSVAAISRHLNRLQLVPSLRPFVQSKAVAGSYVGVRTTLQLGTLIQRAVFIPNRPTSCCSSDSWKELRYFQISLPRMQALSIFLISERARLLLKERFCSVSSWFIWSRRSKKFACRSPSSGPRRIRRSCLGWSLCSVTNY